jgi:Kef-type K+ transport system membrane component KefB
MRRTITVGLVVVGFALMLIGFLSAAPWGSSSVADSDPVMVGAPMLFLLGIVSVVAAAILYELLPDRHR